MAEPQKQNGIVGNDNSNIHIENLYQRSSWLKATLSGGIAGLVLGAGIVAYNYWEGNQTIRTLPNSTPVASLPDSRGGTLSTHSLGWIRIGSVGRQDGKSPVGQALIKTTQPVTISPLVVPTVGDRVDIIEGVKIRAGHPEQPRYKLKAKQGELVQGEEVVILNIESFVDTTVDSSYTAVWAEIGYVR